MMTKNRVRGALGLSLEATELDFLRLGEFVGFVNVFIAGITEVGTQGYAVFVHP